MIRKYTTYFDNNKLPRLVRETTYKASGENLNNDWKIANLLRAITKSNKLTEEHLWLLCFDAKMNVIAFFEITKGSVNYSICNPREIVMKSLLAGAVNIAIAHNHPSGDCNPSFEDRESYRRLSDVCELVGLSLCDSIILGEKEYYTLRGDGIRLY